MQTWFKPAITPARVFVGQFCRLIWQVCKTFPKFLEDSSGSGAGIFFQSGKRSRVSKRLNNNDKILKEKIM